LEVVPLPVPQPVEQRAIAEALSDVDGLIGALEALIAKKRAIKQAAMQQLLTGKTRLPGFSGEWETLSLGDVEKRGDIKLYRGKVISQRDIDRRPGGYPIYSSSVHSNGLFGCYGEYMIDEELITWSVDGGGHFFYRPKHPFSVTNVCGFMRIRTQSINCQYFAYHLQELHSRKVFDYTLKAHPSVIRSSYQVVLPTIEEQREIATVLSDIDAEIAALERRRDKTRAIKQGMMQQLLTGRIRLATPAEPGTTPC
jgi:type I restriction enzyme S subunit